MHNRYKYFVLSVLAVGFALICMPQAYAQSPTFGTELGTGRIICTDDADYKANSDDPSYAISAAWDARVFGDAGIPCFSPLTDLDAGVWKQSEPFSGADAEGRKADFRIYVLHNTYSWQLGSTWKIEQDGVEADPASIFQAPNFMKRFCEANAAFAFGTSSHEGPRGINESTAAKRAATVSKTLTSLREACEEGRIPIVFGINLGEHENDPTCSTKACSAAQRRVIIISADEITTGVDMAAALTAGIEDQNVFEGLDVEKYSLFIVRSY